MAGPELTPDVTGNPRVEVFFDPADLHVDTYRLRMIRFSEDRTWLVRGGVDVAPGVAALDWEVPFQTLATYRAEMFDAAGASLGFSDASSITVDFEGTVVHNPLAPTVFAPVKILPGSIAPLGRPFDGQLVDTEDGEGRFIGSGRRGLRNVTVSLRTDTIEAANDMQRVLGAYGKSLPGVVCIRTSSSIRWPRTFFAQGDLSETERTIHAGGERIQWDGRMNEATPPSPGIVTPLLTYADLDAAFPSYAARDAFYGTYTAQDRDYSLAGLAD